MSRTIKSKPGIGKEYWKSRLHRHGEPTGKYTKKLTAKKERRIDKDIARCLKDVGKIPEVEPDEFHLFFNIDDEEQNG